MKDNGTDRILLAHGGGGQLSDQLLRETILKRLQSEIAAGLPDSATLDIGADSICFTTDSYVVKPLFFPGGDIGKLAVCGTVNDLAVVGSRPVALSLSLIIETGFEMEMLERILDSIGAAAKENNVEVVTGDTKTVESGAADKIFINTAGIGVRLPGGKPGIERRGAGDTIIVNGTIGDHGMTIMSQREDMRFKTQLRSDCAGLADLTCMLFENLPGVRFMRDPTRGGLAVTLNDIARATGLSVEIDEAKLPINPMVQAAADMLGFDVLTIANEGKFVAVVSADDADECLNICREHPLGRDAAVIGRITESRGPAVVELLTKIGGRRIAQMPYGRQLPRIC